MEHALRRRRHGWHPQRTAHDQGAVDGLAPIAPGGIAAPDAPFRVIRRRGDDPHLVTALGEPRGEIGGIFAHADQFRSEVQTEDEDSHVFYHKAKQLRVG